MNKELTPLEALERLRPKTTYLPYYTRNEKRYYCNIIEKALKELESLTNENAVLEYWLKGVFYYIENKEYTLIDISKNLKAVEIIVKKKVDVCLLISCIYDFELNYYNLCMRNKERHLTQEEFDLLKEVLK